MREPPAIEAFGGGGFRAGGRRIEGSILILDDLVREWPVASLQSLTPADFEAVVAVGPATVEFVLLGVGQTMLPPPRPVREALRAAAIGLEVMDTPQACRLYNVLAQEGRRVAAALIAV